MKKDKRTVKAVKEGLRSRSAYKLQEIDRKFHILRERDSVLDLGAWPGGWMIVAKKIVKNGFVLGVDKKKIDSVSGCKFIEGDVTKDELFDKIKKKFDGRFDVVLSDLAPNTSGIKELDRERSFDLSLRTLKIAKKVLKRNGNFLCKVFQSEQVRSFVNRMRKDFKIVRIIKPKASKRKSVEVYVMGKGKLF